MIEKIAKFVTIMFLGVFAICLLIILVLFSRETYRHWYDDTVNIKGNCVVVSHHNLLGKLEKQFKVCSNKVIKHEI